MLRGALRKDAVALKVLKSMYKQLTPGEAQETLRIPPDAYDAARKRIRRLAQKLLRGERHA